MLCPGLDQMNGLERLCIEGTNTLLLEMPFVAWNHHLMETLESLLFDDRYTILFAHIDRYLDQLDLLEYYDYHAQLNVESLKSWHNRKKLLHLAEFGRISAIGSDLHGVSKGYDYFTKCSGFLGEFLPGILESSEKLLTGAKPVH